MKILKQLQRVECSGYVRGYKEAIIYYNELGELIDYETLGTFIPEYTDITLETAPDFNSDLPFDKTEEDL